VHQPNFFRSEKPYFTLLPGLHHPPKDLFGWNGFVSFGDRFYCKKRVLSVLKRKEIGYLYGGMERNRSNRTGPKCPRLLD